MGAPNPRQSLLTPEEVSRRTGITLEKLSRWRTRRTILRQEIGPKFLKLSPHGPVRYMVKDLEEWEGALVAQIEGATAPPKPGVSRLRHQAVPLETGRIPSPCGKMLTPYQLAKRLGVGAAQINEWRRRRYAGEEAGPRFVDLGCGRDESIPMYRLSDVEEWEYRENKQRPRAILATSNLSRY